MEKGHFSEADAAGVVGAIFTKLDLFREASLASGLGVNSKILDDAETCCTIVARE